MLTLRCEAGDFWRSPHPPNTSPPEWLHSIEERSAFSSRTTTVIIGRVNFICLLISFVQQLWFFFFYFQWCSTSKDPFCNAWNQHAGFQLHLLLTPHQIWPWLLTRSRSMWRWHSLYFFYLSWEWLCSRSQIQPAKVPCQVCLQGLNLVSCPKWSH